MLNLKSEMKAKITRCVSFILFLSALHACRGRGATAVGQSLIQLSHDDDLDDNYPEIKDEVHLEDFFWTGSGDGPPDYLKKVHTGISKGKDVIVKTETVVATVYVDGNNEIEIPICLDCKPDDGGGNWDFGTPGVPPMNYSSTDRRYWLLTVMSGFYTAKDNPMLEEKLARLYRLAFTRQQTRHLGINGARQIAGVSIDATRERRQPGLDVDMGTSMSSTTNWPGDDVEVLDMQVDSTHQIKTVWEAGEGPEWAAADSSESGETLSSSAMPPTSSESTDYGAYVTLIPWELIQQNGKSEKLQEIRDALLSQQEQQQQQHRLQQPTQQKQQQHYSEGGVRVVIHNITQISESELQKWNSSANDVAVSNAFVNQKFNDRPVANQTELIYTVLVNGRPVLATTAAKDMELVSEAEAVHTLGKAIYMKSEPYIREPTATALAPVPRSGQAGFFNSVKNNVALVVISSLAILLLMLLLVAILLLGRTRARQQELSSVNRTSSRNELLSEGQSMRPNSRGTLLDSAGGGSTGNAGNQSTARSRDVGVQNFSYEQEPRISFPAPPSETQTRARRDSISSTDNTSDSSVYCPINPPSADVQRILDDKAARLFDAHKRRRHQYDRAEGGLDDTIYASVVSEKKSEKSRHKSKRRYLNENRVGSLETSPRQGSLGQSNSSTEEGNSPAAMRRSYENFQRNEAFNPNNNYHRNKLLQQQQTIFTDKDYPDDGIVGSPQAINSEMMRSRGAQQSEKSSDTASVGSFLSMASVRAFPKSTLPEPLNRVLDPVFVTYYDNVNAVAPQNAAPQNSNRSLKSHKSLGSRDGTIATISSFPSPKAPPPVRSVRSASHSDNPDPGFVGPVVWERHKKRLSGSAKNQEVQSYADFSPSTIHDASAIRNHYEGLLEGAMQMYTSQDDLPMPLPSRDFTNKRRTTKREHRGSSAGLPSFPPKEYSTAERPATAQEKIPKSAHSTQPPSPTYSAWGSSINGSHSPLVRPLSAGPFQRIDTALDMARGPPASSSSTANTPGRKSNSQSASAAPLIEAIQSELRKFKQQLD